MIFFTRKTEWLIFFTFASETKQSKITVMGKRNLFITAFLCILTLSIQAQENYYGKIVDNKQQPISFANVALLNANDSSFVSNDR